MSRDADEAVTGHESWPMPFERFESPVSEWIGWLVVAGVVLVACWPSSKRGRQRHIPEEPP